MTSIRYAVCRSPKRRHDRLPIRIAAQTSDFCTPASGRSVDGHCYGKSTVDGCTCALTPAIFAATSGDSLARSELLAFGSLIKLPSKSINPRIALNVAGSPTYVRLSKGCSKTTFADLSDSNKLQQTQP